MVKTIIYIVSIAILAVLGLDTYLVASGQASPTTIVELATGATLVVALAALALVQALRGTDFRTGRKSTADTIRDIVADILSERFDSLAEKVSDTCDQVREASDRCDAVLDAISDEKPSPAGFIPVIMQTAPDGKLYEAYRLPAAETMEQAELDARKSIEARYGEGQEEGSLSFAVTPVFE